MIYDSVNKTPDLSITYVPAKKKTYEVCLLFSNFGYVFKNDILLITTTIIIRHDINYNTRQMKSDDLKRVQDIWRL